MDAVSAGLACLLCAAQPSALPPAVAQWQPLIAEASDRFGVPETWIARVMVLESGGRTTLNGRPIASSAGAMGLMQIMPGTFAALRLRYGFGADAYDPHDNILAGTAYLRELYQRYGYAALRSRRVIIKSRIVKLAGKGMAGAKAHLRYIQRDGVTRDGRPGQLYDADRISGI